MHGHKDEDERIENGNEDEMSRVGDRALTGCFGLIHSESGNFRKLTASSAPRPSPGARKVRLRMNKLGLIKFVMCDCQE